MAIQRVSKTALFLQFYVGEGKYGGDNFRIGFTGASLIFDFGAMDDRYKVPIKDIARDVAIFRQSQRAKATKLT